MADEDYWTAIARIAKAVRWWFFYDEDGGYMYVLIRRGN